VIKAISVDMWGTLIEDEPGPLETYTLMRLKALWRAISKYSDIDFNSVVEIYKKTAMFTGTIPPRLYAKIVALLLGVNSDKALEEAGFEYEKGAYDYKPVPVQGARELLSYAKSRGLRVVVVTNTSFSTDGALKLLENAGLREYVDYLASSADIGCEKPNPEIFLHALRAIRVKPEETVHIGDSCRRDVIGSVLAGLKPVLYARSQSSVELCKALRIPVVKNLTDVIGVIEAMLKS
jgi:putative hydrolase of the HAD superfamily